MLVHDHKRYIFDNSLYIVSDSLEGLGSKNNIKHRLLLYLYHLFVVKCMAWCYDKMIMNAIQTDLQCDHLFKNCRYHMAVQKIGNDIDLLDRYVRLWANEFIFKLSHESTKYRCDASDCVCFDKLSLSIDSDSDRGSSVEIDDDLEII